MNDATLDIGDPVLPPRRGEAAPPGPSAYELADEVGQGGMGIVYRARDLALDREVAVKVLLAQHAPDSRVARRFVDEGRITAQLQHPGIPAVYQVGTLPDGRPFLAMKLIKGDTLDARLKAGSALDPLAVFEAISQAVGYAHAHGVIHRDLKPGNVMVGAFGEVQVMDWGLAKAMPSGREPAPGGAGDPEATLAPTEIRSLRGSGDSLTQAGSVLGTPAFMAPEQAAGEVAKIDSRTDVFGLGAILCVLLTGKPPFGGGDSESVRLNAVRGKTEEAFARLDASGADPDVIALAKRCLAFAPASRPADGQAVATEVAGLRRAADERARQAERDKLATQVRAAEQRKRRRVLLWAGGAVLALLLAGVAGTTIGLIRADAARQDAETAERATQAKRVEAEEARRAEAVQRQRAEAAKADAQRKEAEANAVLRFFVDKVFAAARPKGQAGGLGKDATLRQAIAASLPALATGFAGQPLVEARLRRTLATTFNMLGDHKAAAEQGERVLAICAKRRGPDHSSTLDAMSGLAYSYAHLRRQDDALALREKVLAVQKRLHGPDHPATLAAMSDVANSCHSLGRRDDALGLRQAVLAGQRRLHGPDHLATITAMGYLANSYTALGRHDESLELRKKVLAVRLRLYPADNANTLIGMTNLARTYAALGRHDESLKLHQEVLATRRRQLPADHPATLTSLSAVVAALVEAKRVGEAVPLIDEYVPLANAKGIKPKTARSMMEQRLRHFQGANDPAGCRATAEKWEKLGHPGSGSLYAAARMRAVAAALYAKASRPAEAAADADRAMGWLAKAVEAGYQDRAEAEADKDLDALRGRADFLGLLASLPKPPGAAKPGARGKAD